MSGFPLTRRAALPPLGLLRFRLSSPFGARSSGPASASAPSRSTSRRSAPAWEIRPQPGCSRRFPERSRTRPPYMAPGDRNGATLVARIDYLFLGPSSGGPGFFRQTQNTINGTLLVEGPRGGVVARVPLTAISSDFPMAVDQALVERALQGRVLPSPRPLPAGPAATWALAAVSDGDDSSSLGIRATGAGSGVLDI